MTDRKPTLVRRTEIADAALEVVAKQGIAALSTRVLAEAVGLSSGALFKHFPSKEALLVGMAERASELLRGTFPEEGLAPAERLRRLASARLSLVSGRAGVLKLVLSEQFALALPEEATALLRAAVRDTHAFVARAIAEGQQDGSLRGDVPAASLALLFLGGLQITALAQRTGAVPAGASALDGLHVLLSPLSPKESP